MDTGLKARFHGAEGVTTGAEAQERHRSPGRADRLEGAPWGREKTDRFRREGSAVRVHDRFGVVIGKGIIEPRLDGGLSRRVCSGVNADALRPQAEVAEDAPGRLRCTLKPEGAVICC